MVYHSLRSGTPHRGEMTYHSLRSGTPHRGEITYHSLRSGTPHRGEKGGFTLIELVLVIALLAVSVGVTNDILISLIRSNNKTQIVNEIEQQANFVAVKIEKELRNARIVLEPEAGYSGNTLKFDSRDNEEITYTLDVNRGVLTRTLKVSSTENTYDLTSNVVPGGVVVECSSDCFSVSGYNPQIVNISFNFRQSQTTFLAAFSGSVLVNSTIVIRNTY